MRTGSKIGRLVRTKTARATRTEWRLIPARVVSSGGGLIRDVAASEPKVFWEAWGVKRPVLNASVGVTAWLDWGVRTRVASRLTGEDFAGCLGCISEGCLARLEGGQFSIMAAPRRTIVVEFESNNNATPYT